MSKAGTLDYIHGERRCAIRLPNGTLDGLHCGDPLRVYIEGRYNEGKFIEGHWVDTSIEFNWDKQEWYFTVITQKLEFGLKAERKLGAGRF